MIQLGLPVPTVGASSVRGVVTLRMTVGMVVMRQGVPAQHALATSSPATMAAASTCPTNAMETMIAAISPMKMVALPEHVRQDDKGWDYISAAYSAASVFSV